MGDSGDAKQPFDRDGMERLRDDIQGGVISRRQLRELHAEDHDIRRLVRNRELTAIHPGVYVNHTGNPTWGQRACAAVLACWPAALTGRSALPKPREHAPIDAVAEAADINEAFSMLADLVQSKALRAGSLIEALGHRRRLRDRHLLL
jgi:hypothetical protein